MQCPKCNYKKLFDFVVCPKCGYDLNEEYERKLVLEKEKPMDNDLNSILEIKAEEMNEETTNKSNSEEFIKVKQNDPILCVECGVEVSESDLKCPKCGSDLEKIVNNEDQNYGFNFGAGFLAPIWFITHGKAGVGFLLIIYSLFSRIFGVLGIGGFLLGNLVTIGLIVYCGSIGNKIAMKNKGYSTIKETKEKENGWNIAGIIVGIIYVIMIIINLSSVS